MPLTPELVLTMDPPEVGSDLAVTGTGFDGAGHATLTTALAGSNNDLKYDAVEAGINGNAVTIAYVDPGGASAVLGVVVTGSAIVVNLGRASSAINTTATLLRAAILATPAAVALVTVALAAANDGTGLVTALGATHLAGATDAASVDVVVHGPDEIFVLEETCATDGSGNITLGTEDVEVERPGTVHATAAVAGTVVATASLTVFQRG